MPLERRKPGHRFALDLERGHPVRDALLCFRHYLENRLTERFQGTSLRLVERSEVLVDVSGRHGGQPPISAAQDCSLATGRASTRSAFLSDRRYGPLALGGVRGPIDAGNEEKRGSKGGAV